jgi:hypothetical protein
MTIRTTRKQTQSLWQGIIKQFQASGLKQKEFCRKNRVKLPSLQYWLRKADTNPDKRVTETPFVEVGTVHPKSTIETSPVDTCEITMPSGIRFVFNESMDTVRLGQIVNTLRGIPC